MRKPLVAALIAACFLVSTSAGCTSDTTRKAFLPHHLQDATPSPPPPGDGGGTLPGH